MRSKQNTLALGYGHCPWDEANTPLSVSYLFSAPSPTLFCEADTVTLQLRLIADDLITRTDLYEHALMLALIPFRPKNAHMYTGVAPFC